MYIFACVIAVLVAFIILAFALIHYAKSCDEGDFSGEGKLLNIISFKFHGSGSKRKNK